MNATSLTPVLSLAVARKVRVSLSTRTAPPADAAKVPLLATTCVRAPVGGVTSLPGPGRIGWVAS